MEPSDDLLDVLVQWEAAAVNGQARDLTAICADRPAMLPRLRDCIRHLAEIDRTLDLGPEAEIAISQSHPPADPLPVVAGYEVLSEVGRGGMGVVYLARHPLLNRQVAIKVLRADRVSSPEPMRRAVREAQALARLRHPHIVSVFDVRAQDHQVFLFMEWVPGGSLAAQVNRGRLEPAAAARLIAQVAGAVQHAHEHGILHRDLKPANILLDADGSPRVADFGIARFTDSDARDPPLNPVAADAETQTNLLTVPGTRPGTPPYMAPEQIRPDIEPVTARTDVWALGVILYELLAGRRPFDGTRPEIERAICWAEPTTIGDGGKPVDPGLVAVVEKCLRKNPIDRYATAGEVAGALEQWQAARTRPAATTNRFSRATRSVRRPAALLTSTAIVAVLAVAAWSALRTPVASPPTDLPMEEEVFARAIEPAQRALADGKSVTLISPETTNLSYRWPFGGGASLLRIAGDVNEDGPIFVSSRTPALLEIFSAPDNKAFRVTAELRQEPTIFDDEANLGLYVAREAWTNAQGDQQTFARCVFADLGPQSRKFKENGVMGSRVQFGQTVLGPSVRNPAREHAVQTPALWYSAPNTDNRSGLWRTVSIDVRPAGLRAHWGQERIGEIRVDEWMDFFTQVQRGHLDLTGLTRRATFEGGVGIYVFGASLSVRRFMVEPLDQ